MRLPFNDIEQITDVDASLLDQINQYKIDIETAANALHSFKGFERDCLLEAYTTKMVNQWYDLLGVDKRVVRKHIGGALNPTIPDRKVSYTTEELLALPQDIQSVIMPYLIGRTGLYILAGPAKLGKSYLCYKIAYAATVSGSLFGFPFKRCKTLYLPLEEDIFDVKKRIVTSGFIDKNNVEAQLAIDSDALHIELEFNALLDIQWLENKIIEGGYELVIIDSLRMSVRGSGIDQNQPVIGEVLYTLQHLFHRLQVAGIVIDHTNKSQETAGANKLSGSSAKQGANDGMIFLESYGSEEDNSQVMLYTVPRRFKPIRLVYERVVAKNGRWDLELRNILSIPRATQELIKRIIRLLANTPGEFIQELVLINSLTSQANGSTIEKALGELVDNALIECQELSDNNYGYRLPANSIYSTNKPSFINQDIRDSYLLPGLTSRNEVKDFVRDWDVKYRNKIFSLLTDQERGRLLKISKTPNFRPGEYVFVRGEKHQIQTVVTEKVTINNCSYQLDNGLIVEEEIVEPYTDIPMSEEQIVENLQTWYESQE